MKVINVYVLTACLVFSTLSLSVQAQQTQIQRDPVQIYQSAHDLFLKSLYGNAREQFEYYLQHYPQHEFAINAEYYIGLCALYQGQTDAEELIQEFITKHPEHPKTSDANLEMGSYYYNAKNYDNAIVYFDKVNWASLNSKKQLEGKFRIGYCYFTKKDFDKAITYFNASKASDNRYQYASRYYAAYIEFKKGLLDESLKDLNEAEKNEEFKPLVPQLKANILYKKNAYDELITYAKPLVEGSEEVLARTELTLLLAEAYYQKQDYKNAFLFFQKAESTKTAAFSRDVNFRIGFSAYETKNIEPASKYFENLAGNRDTIGQASAYYLGLTYLELGNKESALIAFSEAKNANFLPAIKEQSSFLEAKLAFDLENYTYANKLLKEYIELYPTSNYAEEASGMLSESFLHTKDYVSAIEYFEKIKKRSVRVNTAFQLLTYYRAIELYNQVKFKEAIDMFDKAINHPYNKEIVLNSLLWKGEALSNLREYEEAINVYAQIFKTTSIDDKINYKARYGIGYAYYNTKQFDKAIPHFKAYADNWNKSENEFYYKDAIVRLADLYYVTKSYKQAIAFYDKAIEKNIGERDYLIFQKGVVYNLSNQSELAKQNFQTVIQKYPNSMYYDHALYQQAQLLMEASDYNGAIKDYSTIIVRKDPNGYIPYAYQKRALAYFNIKKYAEAKADYISILDRYIQHPVSHGALVGLQEILALEGTPDQFDAYLTQYKTANPEKQGLKELEYSNALSLYSNQRYEQAAANFTQFITKYPDHVQKPDAEFYIAESYYRLKKYSDAEVYYTKVLENKDKYYNRSIGRIAEVENQLGNHEKAIVSYSLLKQYANTRKEQFVAWVGLMENYYATQSYDSSLKYANEILANGNPVIDAQNKALIYKTRIHYTKGEFDQAKDNALTLMNSNRDAYAAEANYLLADMQYKEKEYQASLETLYSLNENFSTYSTWFNKSFLLIVENLIALKEDFQAKATLQSIIENSTDPATVEQAKKRLSEINQSAN